MCARSFALVVALLLVVAQCAEVKSIQNQFEFLLNTAMVEKANAGQFRNSIFLYLNV